MCAAAGVALPAGRCLTSATGAASGAAHAPGSAPAVVDGAEVDRIFLAANYEEDKKSAESKVRAFDAWLIE
jgi:hypothetical protein